MKNRSLPLPKLPPRRLDSHKGDYGRALLVGGSMGLTGAIGLAGMSALRAGAGLVTLAIPEVCLPIVASYEPSYMTQPLAADPEGKIRGDAVTQVLELARHATAVGCGPGLGRSDALVQFVERLYLELSSPAVFDADALFALASLPQLPQKAAGPRILTPHLGEFERLQSRSNHRAGSDRVERAEQFASQLGAILVLKGHETIVTSGEVTYVNRTGNPGMATGGTGDVLTGIITALLCQGMAAFQAAQLGVYLHGLAGDQAAARLGQISLTARDLVDELPDAFQAHQSAET